MRKYRWKKKRFKRERIVSDSGYRNQGAVLLFLFLFPYVVSFFFGNVGTGEDRLPDDDGKAESLMAEMYREDPEQSRFIVCNTTAAGTERIPMETWLIARLPATIPVDYEPETLKAQTVALRTELMRLYYDGIEEENENGGKKEKQSAGEKEKQNAGKRMERSEDGHIYLYTACDLTMTDGAAYEKCKKAVESTEGMYLTFNGAPIKAPYFAVSAGATRNGNEALKSDEYPYLKSVMCPRDFTSDDYTQSVKMDRTAFALQLHEAWPDIGLTEDGQLSEELLIERDRAGYVLSIGAGGSHMSGEAFRDIFSLSSACFTIEWEGSQAVLRTKGVGHGLGLCQYAANEAAKKGSDFIDILNYFFTDVMIEKTE